VGHSGRVAGLLDAHAEVHDVHDDLHVALGLELPAHDPEAQEGLAAPGDEAGDDGVEGALAGRVAVGPALVETEQFAPVLEAEAQPGGHAAAHAPEIALDQAHHAAFPVGHREVDGVAVLQGGMARLQPP
jgi:hypothetical protein